VLTVDASRVVEDKTGGFSGTIQFSPFHRAIKLLDTEARGSRTFSYFVFGGDVGENASVFWALDLMVLADIEDADDEAMKVLLGLYGAASQHWGIAHRSKFFKADVKIAWLEWPRPEFQEGADLKEKASSISDTAETRGEEQRTSS
jgi:hypothetical protein